MKKAVLIFLLILIPFSLFAENFYIDSYDISIDVHEDGSIHVEETLDTVFTSPSHGIIRDIQYLFDNPNDKYGAIKAEVSNIKSNLPFAIERSNSFISIRLGDSSRYITGRQIISISYDYDLGGDLYPTGYDEFYYNLISASFDCTIENITYTITFPKPIDENKIWLSSGYYGTYNEVPFKLSGDKKAISGFLPKLAPYSALTLRVEMENGYFARQAKNSALIALVAYPISAIVAIAFTIYAILSYRKYGVDNELTPPIVFYPPEGMNPMEVGYLYDGKLDSEKEITAMLFYWADKGYIRIEEKNEKANSMAFIKLKNIPDSSTLAEKTLFIMLFKSGESVTFKDLEKSEFGINAPAKVFPLIKKQFTGDKSLKDPIADKKKKFNTGLMFIALTLSSLIASLPSIGFLSVILAITTLVGSAFSIAFSANIVKHQQLGRKGVHLLSLIPLVIIGFIVFSRILDIDLYFLNNPISYIHAATITLSMLTSSIAINATEKRSKYGERVLEECLGYKDFIDKVEIDKLKLLIDTDPEIFYHTLSFAIVFGLEDKWASKFKELYIPKCNWYYSSSDALFDAMFYSAMIRRSRYAYRSMQRINTQNNHHSRPISGGGGSGSFSGFRGFSGGGFSGGGARSW